MSSRSASKPSTMSKSYLQNRPETITNRLNENNTDIKKNRSSMVERPLDKKTGDLTIRSRSSAMPRRPRNERKRSNDQGAKQRKSTINRVSSTKNSTSNRFSKYSDVSKSHNLNDITTTETYTNTTLYKGGVRAYEPSEKSDNMVSMYSSNHSSNHINQLRTCCKKFTLK